VEPAALEETNGHGSGGDAAGGDSGLGAGQGREIVRDVVAGHGGPSFSSEGIQTNGGSSGSSGGGTSVMTGSRKELMMEPMGKMDTLSQQTAKMMGDAPTCTCGAITIRNGSCYKCLNCGASLGCS
jgi:hypothetical protein